MLFVQFYVGTERYVLASQHVVDIIPVVVWKTVPDVTKGVAGLFNYHGAAVPLVDLSSLMCGTPSAIRMGTRIIVVDPAEERATDSERDTIFGVLVERVIGTLHLAESDFQDAGAIAQGAAYAGPLLVDDNGIIQRITVGELLPASVRDQLLRQCSPA